MSNADIHAFHLSLDRTLPQNAHLSFKYVSHLCVEWNQLEYSPSYNDWAQRLLASFQFILLIPEMRLLESTLPKYAWILDKVFFGGSLGPEMYFELRDTLTVSDFPYPTFGLCDVLKIARTVPPAFITYISIYNFHELANPGTRLTKILQTLIHEMVHAYHGIHGCRDKTCEECSNNNGGAEMGFQGHGLSFVAIGQAITSSRFFKGMDLQLQAIGSLEALGCAHLLTRDIEDYIYAPVESSISGSN